MANAKVSTLTDAFPGTSLNTSKWSGEGQGTITVAGGNLTFSATNGPSDDMYNAVNSNAAYDATGSAALVKISPNTTTTQADTGFGYWSSELVNGWTMGVVVNGVTNGVTSAYVQKWVNNNYSFVWSATYSATSHAWMQITESGGTLSFQTSPDGSTWTTRYSTTSESITGGGNNLSLTGVTVQVYFGFQDNVKRSGSASFADFNVAPSGGGGGGGGGGGTVSPPSAPILGMYQTNGAFPTPGPSAWPSGPATNLSATYLAWDLSWNTYAAPFVTECNDNGLIAFVELEPWGSNQTPIPFASITSGTYDSQLEGYGTAIAATGKPVILTFAHEFNVSGQYPWAQQFKETHGGTASGPGGADLAPSEWVAGWKYVHDKVNSTANGYAIWMWACSAWTAGTTVDPSPWWPGTSYTDMVGIDGYPSTEYGSDLGTFSGQIQQTVTAIRTLGWTADIFISETNLAQMADGNTDTSVSPPVTFGPGQDITSFVADMYAAGISGILEFEDATWNLPQMSNAQWTQYNNAIAANYTGGGSGTANPKFGTLTDAFTGSTLSNLWTGTATVSGGECGIACTSAYGEIQTAAAYDLTGSQVMFGVQPFIGTDGGSYATQILLGDQAAANGYLMGYDAGTLVAYSYVNYTGTTTYGSADWDPAAMAYWKVSESGGTITFAYSATGQDGSWTTLGTTTDETVASLTAMYATIMSGWYSSTGTNGTSYITDFNTEGGGSGPSGGGTLTVAPGTPDEVSASSGVAHSVTAVSPPAGSMVRWSVAWLNSNDTLGFTFTAQDSNGVSYGAPTHTGSPGDGDGGCYLMVWDHTYATAPGSVTLTVTASGSGLSGAAPSDCLIMPYVITGQAADQSTAGFNVFSEVGDPTTTYELSLTTTVPGSVVFVLGAPNHNGGATGAVTAISTTVTDVDWDDGNVGSRGTFGRSKSATVTPGATTFGWTSANPSPNGYGLFASEVIPASGPAGPSSPGLLMARIA